MIKIPKIAFEDITNKAKIALAIGLSIMVVFFVLQTLIVFGAIDATYSTALLGYLCILLFMPPFFVVLVEFLKNKTSIVKELEQKNTYLEHAAKIIRHDMHSGINTYIPRGISSLERRVSPQEIDRLKIESPLKMIKDGLKHTQKVYKGVYEFTNLVKKNAEMSKVSCNVKNVLDDYLSLTSYKSQVTIDDSLSFDLEINEPLFCTAVDNLIRNGLKYNDSTTKHVKVYREGRRNSKSGAYIVIEDNGRGMSQKDFDFLSRPYTRLEGQKEEGTGLGLNICISILKEHKFIINVEKIKYGSKDFYRDLDRIEKKVTENPDGYYFDKDKLEKIAISAKFSGKLKTRIGGRDKSKLYVIYEMLETELSKGTKIKIKIN